MAKSRLITTNLIRSLDRSSQPVYLIGNDQGVEYANQACLKWLRLDPDQIKSVRCVYTSQELDGPIENRIRGLTPPPVDDPPRPSEGETESSRPTNFSAFCDSAEGVRQWRNATAHRLNDETATADVLVVCSTEVFESLDDANANQDLVHAWCVDPAVVHEALAHIRGRMNDRYPLDSVLGLPSINRSLRKKIDAAIGTVADVLIHGPAGSGREQLARVIDTHRRPDAIPPIPLHCAVADQQLIQQNIKELFTDPASDHSSNRECLLLIEVDRLSPVAQAELWGFLRLPGFTFQTMSTASSSLIDLARQEKFHRELAAFLTTIEIELLPLCERPGDIPLLAQACVENINLTQKKQLAGFSPAAMQLLQQYDWPENIDQLHRDVRSAAEIATGAKIVLEDLPASLRQASQAMEIGRAEETVIKLDEYLQTIESELIARAMQQAKGNKSKAAKLLGISRPKLIRRLQILTVPNGIKDSTATDQVDSSAFEEADDE